MLKAVNKRRYTRLNNINVFIEKANTNENKSNNSELHIEKSHIFKNKYNNTKDKLENIKKTNANF